MPPTPPMIHYPWAQLRLTKQRPPTVQTTAISQSIKQSENSHKEWTLLTSIMHHTKSSSEDGAKLPLSPNKFSIKIHSVFVGLYTFFAKSNIAKTEQ